MAYSNAWRSRAYQQIDLQGTVPALEHREPQDLQTNRNWQNAPQDPNIPEPGSQVLDPGAFAVNSAPGGPVYNPPGHDFGVGYGAGLDWATAMAQNNSARETDDGSYLPRHTLPVVSFDGKYNVSRMVMPYPDEDGLRPAGTPDIPAAPGMQQGLNRNEYPNRRQGHYTTRWRDRVYTRRTWDVEFRPVITPNAYTAPEQQPVANGNQYTSPYAAAQTVTTRNVLVTAPQLRRTPNAWDESITVDGTDQNAAAGNNYGFASFGGF
jgi:hypothetical protein